MPPKGKQQLIAKLSPLKDGDASGNLGKPPDDVTKLALPSSCRESGATTPKSSNIKTTGLEEAQEKQSDADVYASETSDAFRPSTLKYHSMSQSQKILKLLLG
jgi:hypothetical protein